MAALRWESHGHNILFARANSVHAPTISILIYSVRNVGYQDYSVGAVLLRGEEGRSYKSTQI